MKRCKVLSHIHNDVMVSQHEKCINKNLTFKNKRVKISKTTFKKTIKNPDFSRILWCRFFLIYWNELVQAKEALYSNKDVLIGHYMKWNKKSLLCFCNHDALFFFTVLLAVQIVMSECHETSSNSHFLLFQHFSCIFFVFH